MIDWGEGAYEHTAEEIAPASQVLVTALLPRRGQRILDVGCGTGNAALLAAGTGARITGIDPAQRLIKVARDRAAAAGLEVDFAVGDATALQFCEASFDAVISVFAVIFAGDPPAAASELLRVTRPEGRILLTAWNPEGTIASLGRASAMAVAGVTQRTPQAPTDWSDPAALRRLFGPDARIALDDHILAFTAESPAAMLQRFVDHHPMYHANRAVLEPDGRWEPLLEELIALLEAGNEDPAAFRATSRYELVTVTRGPAATRPAPTAPPGSRRGSGTWSRPPRR